MKTYISRHPLTLLIIGTFLSSILIPAISHYITEKNRREEARVQLANEIVENDFTLSNYLNNLKTTLEMFHKDNCTLQDKAALKEEQLRLRWKMNDLYLEFERKAWFWSEMVYQKAYYLDLSDQNLSLLSENLLAYHQNLVECTQIIAVPWTSCLRKDYQFCDTTTARLFTIAADSLQEQHRNRNLLVHQTIICLSGKPTYLLNKNEAYRNYMKRLGN